MTLLVRDEEDILSTNIEFHLAKAVDFFVITDNLSADSTPDIIDEYVRTGVAQYLHEARDDFSQHRWVTRMARMAALDYGADWVINSDADEFWLSVSGSGSIKEALADVGGHVPAFLANRSNFIPLGWERRINPVQEMIFKEQASNTLSGKPLPPKVAHRAFPDIVVEQGNHGVWRNGTRLHSIAGPLQIFHYPLRSYEQFENKIVKGGAAYEANTELGYQTGSSWRELYKLWQEGELPSYFGERILSPEEIEAQLRKGALLIDETAAHVLKDAGSLLRAPGE